MAKEYVEARGNGQKCWWFYSDSAKNGDIFRAVSLIWKCFQHFQYKPWTSWTRSQRAVYSTVVYCAFSLLTSACTSFSQAQFIYEMDGQTEMIMVTGEQFAMGIAKQYATATFARRLNLQHSDCILITTNMSPVLQSWEQLCNRFYNVWVLFLMRWRPSVWTWMTLLEKDCPPEEWGKGQNWRRN